MDEVLKEWNSDYPYLLIVYKKKGRNKMEKVTQISSYSISNLKDIWEKVYSEECYYYKLYELTNVGNYLGGVC